MHAHMHAQLVCSHTATVAHTNLFSIRLSFLLWVSCLHFLFMLNSYAHSHISITSENITLPYSKISKHDYYLPNPYDQLYFNLTSS